MRKCGVSRGRSVPQVLRDEFDADSRRLRGSNLRCPAGCGEVGGLGRGLDHPEAHERKCVDGHIACLGSPISLCGLLDHDACHARVLVALVNNSRECSGERLLQCSRRREIETVWPLSETKKGMSLVELFTAQRLVLSWSLVVRTKPLSLMFVPFFCCREYTWQKVAT